MNQENVGRFISETRKSQGMTQKQLADQIGISDKTISKWECGKGLPEITILKSLCDALKVNVNELLSGERLTETDYSIKAEENIMALMKENEINKKTGKMQIIMGGVLIIAAFLLLYLTTNGYGYHLTMFMDFIDIPTMLLLILFYGAAVLLSGKRTKASVLGVLQKVCIPISAFIALYEIVVVLKKMYDVTLLGPNMAICVLSMIYGVGVYIVVSLWKMHVE